MENKSGLRPLGHAVLIKPYEVEETTRGGIILAGGARERQEMAEQRGIVVEVGPAAWVDEPVARAAPGQRILFAKYAGHACKGPLDGESYRVVNARDIFLAITAETVESAEAVEVA